MRKTDRLMGPILAPGAVLALLVLSALMPASASAEVLERDVLADSTITLVENATFASYRTLTVTLATRDGNSTLTADKDGVVTSVAMRKKECLAVWRAVLQAGIENITHAPSGPLPPDQSHFTVSFSTASGTNSFTAYGVDALADTRYREIVREILHATDAHAYGKSWQK